MTIISIFFPDFYTVGPEREARYLLPPLESYAEVHLPSDDLIIEQGEEPLVLEFRWVFVPEAQQRQQIQRGNCMLLHAEHIFTIFGSRVPGHRGGFVARGRTNPQAINAPSIDDAVLHLSARELARYNPPPFHPLAVDGQPLTIAGDALGVGGFA